jgi:hypothetical protein
MRSLLTAQGLSRGRAALAAGLLFLLAFGFGAGFQFASHDAAPADDGASLPAPAAAPITEPAALRTPADAVPVSPEDAERYLPLYRRAAHRFGVNWLLLASIHAQETAFSTAPGTYHGLNFAKCCAGPMQFNVKNGKPSTWQRFRRAHEMAPRPAGYPHATARHPSVYDDFDAIMAAAWLLRENGAGAELDGTAWSAAYQYYGPGDPAAVDYANQVLARATIWERDGFDASTIPEADLIASFESDYGAAVRAQISAPEASEDQDRKKSREKADEPAPKERSHDRPRRRDQSHSDSPRRHEQVPPDGKDEESEPTRTAGTAPPPGPFAGAERTQDLAP